MRQSVLIFLLIIFLGVFKLPAQIVHSSQFYSIPLLLNPALVGNSDYNFRGGVNYRNQWNSVTIPFVSQAVFADGKLSTQRLSSSWIGLGGMVFNDKAGDGDLKTTQAMFASSFNKSLNAGNTLFLHLGMGVEMINKSVDVNKLTFGRELDNPGSSSGENFISQSLFYMDFSLGFQMTYFKGKTRYFMGSAVSHINEPDESFYRYEDEGVDFSTNNLKRRFTWHGGFESKLSSRMNIKPELMYTTEEIANLWIAGANFMSLFGNKGTMLHYGLWYRSNQDIIPAFGYEKKRLKIMLTYDVNISGLSRGGLEISLSYNHNYSNPREIRKLNRRQKVKKLGSKAISCPKFLREN